MRSALLPAIHRRRKVRLALLVAIALLPNAAKLRCYRWLFDYDIAAGVRIGVSVIDVSSCRIAEGTVLGHGNVVTGVRDLRIGDHVRIGHLNVIRGGDEVEIGRYAEIHRLNEINSIPDPWLVNSNSPTFSLGAGSIVTAGHKIDFTDSVTIGVRTVLGGRNSSLWTHNRQRSKPIVIGSHTYLGSDIRMAPGAAVPSRAIVGMGAVVVDPLDDAAGTLIVGVPARAVRPLTPDDEELLATKTRPDLPDDI